VLDTNGNIIKEGTGDLSAIQEIMGLRGIEWVILGLKTRQSWGLQGDSAF
jgi:hypothetical protein